MTEVRESERYEIYTVRGSVTRCIAATSLDGIGLTLRTLREEGQLDAARVGVRDRSDKSWIINPWTKGES